MLIEFCKDTQKWKLNHPLMPFAETCKKHKKCCKNHKKGDRCKKCPGRK
ncbi:MAG: hypothetical protein JNK50_08230 [Bacteroidia bacterium]|nr:hypothetical protein [Bacteroidia bacterium]MBN8691754.1 hypothetical protein [Bacteroidota bacterium]